MRIKTVKRSVFLFLIFLVSTLCETSIAQQFLETSLKSKIWVDKEFSKLSRRQKIAQLMVIRLSERRGNEAVFYEKEVLNYIRKYNIGSVCLFQGNSAEQARVLNVLQAKAKTPLLVCIDGETGVGMRFGDVSAFPDQLTIGAGPDAALAYKVGQAIARQCKRAGIQVDYAPVVDINNNPDNPVINFRSFGEDQYKVSAFGTQIMRGMQDGGVMACAKHFPGHGDVAVDSHLDLPVINKTLADLDSLELQPFKSLIQAGVGSMMVAHLYIPSIDNTLNQASSLSRKNVTGLLRDQLGFKGITFTDALEMKGVSKFYPQGEAAVQSIIAGNDMLCLPGDVRGSIKKVRKAIRRDKLEWADIDEKVRRVLLAKYNLGLDTVAEIQTKNISEELNSEVSTIKKEVYASSITLLKQNANSPLPLSKSKRIAYVAIGVSEENQLASLLKQNLAADCYYFGKGSDSLTARNIIEKVRQYDVVLVGLHQYRKYPANNFGIPVTSIDLLRHLNQSDKVVNLVFGNPYAIKNLNNAGNIIACYEDDKLMHSAAFDLLVGKTVAKGRLPVTVSPEFPFGTGITNGINLPARIPASLGFNENKLNEIDAIALNAIDKGATPGAVVLVARKGQLVFQRAYGSMNYDKKQGVTLDAVFDLASLTKTSATTVAIMKLYEEGKLDLDKTLGDYLPWSAGSDKSKLKVRDILLHQAGLVSSIPFSDKVSKMGK